MKTTGITDLQKAILYASILGSILNEYTYQESNKAIFEIKAKIAKFMKQRKRTNPKDYITAVMHGKEVWHKAMEATENARVTGVHLVMAIWETEEQLLARMANLSEKRMNKFGNLDDGKHELEAEENAFEVGQKLVSFIKEIA